MDQKHKTALEKLIGIETEKNAAEYPLMNFRSLQKLETEEGCVWPEFDSEPEGQLALDVYEKGDNLIVKSTIAGAKPEDIEISLHHDMLTIRGRRETDTEINKEDYYSRECYWGNFSRSLILPFSVQTDRVRAELKHGVLTVILPKAERQENSIPVEIIEE